VVLEQAPNRRPRPWRHVESLKSLANKLNDGEVNEESDEKRSERQKENVKQWFENTKVTSDVGGSAFSAEAFESASGFIDDVRRHRIQPFLTFLPN
jgi:hypothetical protein